MLKMVKNLANVKEIIGISNNQKLDAYFFKRVAWNPFGGA